MAEQWNNDGGTVEQIWWTGGIVKVGQWNGDGGTVEQWNRSRYGGTVEQ